MAGHRAPSPTAATGARRGPEVEALAAYDRAATGEHPDRDEYRAPLVADRRVPRTMTVAKGDGDGV